MSRNHDYDNKFEFKLTLSIIEIYQRLEKWWQVTTKVGNIQIGTIMNLSYPWLGNLDWLKTKIIGNRAIYWIATKIWDVLMLRCCFAWIGLSSGSRMGPY